MSVDPIVRTVLIFFPLIPLLGNFFILTAKYALRRDLSGHILVVTLAAQVAAGVILTGAFHGVPEVYRTAVSQWNYSIMFAFDGSRVFFLVAYLIPVVFTVLRLHLFPGQNVRILFLFYLAGCSGLLVTGDLFTFYVFYEVMIMAAYVLIGIKGKYYASIKYMLIGASSSALFLAGVILLYASGVYFDFAFASEINPASAGNLPVVLLLFSTAFLIKGAFFPVSSWVSTCHSATHSLMSAFLSAFTIFTGIFGLYNLVLVPAEAMGFSAVFSLLRIISLLTMVVPAFFLFFEPHLKRVIAGTTVFTIGFIGLMLSYRLYDVAFTYVVVHALYKTLLFLLYDHVSFDETSQDALVVQGSAVAFGAAGVGLVFTVGLFPALTYALKYQFIGGAPHYRVLLYIAMFLVLGSFFKFRYRRVARSEPLVFYGVFALFFAAMYLLFPYTVPAAGSALVIDGGVILVAVVASRRLYRLFPGLSCIDTRLVYRSLNHELLYMVLLFLGTLVYLRTVAASGVV